jgi:hypothetical protein
MKLWIPKEILQEIEADPIRTYLLLKMLVQHYSPVKDLPASEGQAVDYVILGMMAEMKRQFPKVEKMPAPAPNELN